MNDVQFAMQTIVMSANRSHIGIQMMSQLERGKKQKARDICVSV